MDEIEDDGWFSDPMRNETRYQMIIDGSIFPPFAFLRESFKEDRSLLLPRMLLSTFWTARRIPRSLLLWGEARERFAIETMKRWARTVVRMARIKLEIRGAERIDPSATYLFACNHSGPLDSIIAYLALPLVAAFVVNVAVTSVPVIKYWVEKSGCVLVHQDGGEGETRAFKDMLAKLKQGRNLLIFPEGYIYQGSGLADFKRGGLYSALFAGASIVPMCVYGAQDVMRSGSLHVKPDQRVCVEFGEPISTKNLTREERKRAESVVHDRILAMKLKLAAEWKGAGS